jgi:hypothetical protein
MTPGGSLISIRTSLGPPWHTPKRRNRRHSRRAHRRPAQLNACPRIAAFLHDPVGCDQETYRRTAATMESMLVQRLDELLGT